MEWNIPEDLRDYVQGQVLPLYQRSDSAHGPEHIRQVLANSWELAQGLGADLRLVYVVAAYHDLGIAFFGRQDHHLTSARLLREDGAMEYGKARFPEKDTSWPVRRAVEHIREKYGEGGYLKLWLHSPRNQAGLDKLRQWLATGELEEVCKRSG